MTGQEANRWEAAMWLGLNFIPIDKASKVTKAGKVADKLDDVADVAKAADKASDITKTADKLDDLADAGKVAEKAKDVGKVIENVDIEKISKSASEIRNSGGETRAGHALQKHAGRNPDIWGKVKGNSEAINAQADKHLKEIIEYPSDFKITTTDRGTRFIEKSLPDGRGVRLNMDGTFKGFIDK